MTPVASQVLVLLTAALAGAWALTGAMRRFALRLRMLDVPNSRTMHEGEVPRGGGVAIVAVLLPGLTALALLGLLELRPFLALAGGIVMVAGVSWVDDRGHVHSAVRVAIHVTAAAWAVAWLGGMPRLDAGVATLALGPAGWPLAVLGLVWLINLYNFMDGIDGIAGGEAVTVGGISAALLLAADAPGPAAAALLLAAASAGFLLWNWPPARIFMGDVGSATLGFVFGTLALATENAGQLPLLIWVILLGAFWFDATVTLVRRLLRGERVYAPHRQHAYQRAVQAGRTHGTVSSAVLATNLGLGMLAWLALLQPARLPIYVGLAVLGLTVLYVLAGRTGPADRSAMASGGRDSRSDNRT